ncbi:hypothetical protein D8I35_03725 [Corticibacter populi]|uniref:Uncharacterized protein n=1 Tax=Corticibacter populi TaxID=1550736 RepID=A0A3M6R017_9BURK|nr:hypothetical protein [Corticibacter populi]RMX08229.1 hypothetical protein D8I35_03725 [Corticibacter populi]RZS35503.1 hypothetical protein EV687_0571 [Corticibacter populi]
MTQPGLKPSFELATDVTPDDVLQSMLLDWFGQVPITIHRPFVDITGSVLAALWLSHALNRPVALDSTSAEVVIEMTAAECELATGITRAQQQTCRRILADKGIAIEERSGRSIRYRIYTQRILELLQIQARPLAEAMRGGQR